MICKFLICIIDYNFFRQKIQGDFLNKYNFCFIIKFEMYFKTQIMLSPLKPEKLKSNNGKQKTKNKKTNKKVLTDI